jgi:hypothetical protein
MVLKSLKEKVSPPAVRPGLKGFDSPSTPR